MKFVPKSESTRKFIIEATAGIFNRKGYAGTSLSDLTKATQLTKGSIYGNFENKEEVALAVFDYNLSLRRMHVNQKMKDCKNYKEMLLAHANAYRSNESGIFLNGGCPLLNTATEADDTNEPLRKRAAEGLINWKNSLVALIRKGMAAGEFREDIDTNQIALSIVAIIEGAVLIGKATQNPAYLDTILETVQDLIKKIER